MLDIAVSVYSPNGQTCLVNDVVTASGGTNSPIYKAKYEDTPDGGGAGELTLGLRYNEFYDLGYWSWRNLVEISTGDNFLTAATSATPSGSLKCYIDAIWGFDPARGEDAQLAYLNDGVNKVVRCPVQSIGYDNAPTIVHNASTTTTTAATSITRGIATPTAGNRLIAIVSTNNVAITGPSGWTTGGGTVVSGALGLAMYHKVAAGTETSVTITFGSAVTATLTVLEVSGGGTPTFALDASPDTQIGPALRSPVISTTPIGSLLVAAFAIENGANLVAPYGWNTSIPNNPSPSSATNYALGLAAVSATDTNPYQAYASWNTYGTTNLGACAAIVAIPPSGTVNPWITIGQPAGGGGIPAYAAAVTTVGRRRYCGMVTKRTRPNQKIPGGTVTLTGLQNALQGAIGTFNIALAAAVDVSLTCYDAFDYIPPGAVSAQNFATSHFPFLTFPGSLPSPLYPPTGNVYSGNNSQISVDQFLAYVIQATTADGDQWNLRIGHDRTPRLAKYFDGTTDVYLYNVTLDQSSWSFSALAVQTVDEQDNGTYNAVEVVGATGATGVQASAIVLNTTQIANLGYQIDGTPQYNTALTTTAQCAAQAASLLESNSTAPAANTCTVYTHDDLVTSSCAPGGVQRGDVVRAGANLTLTGFPGDAPNQSGLVLSAVTTLDFQKMESQQDVSFQAIVPDYRVAAAEQANALATALAANQNTLSAVDQYCVSSAARGYTTNVASLSISFPAFLALFAPGTNAVSIGAANVTCVANASNWIWLNPNGTYSVYQTNTFVSGAILMLVAQMGATGWVGDSGLKASIGVVGPNGTTFLNSLTDSFVGLTNDPTTGFLAMPAGSGIAIYPYTESLTLGSYTGAPVESAPISSYVTFVMSFSNSSTSPSAMVSAALFTSASGVAGTFANGYYLEYFPSTTTPTLRLSKNVSGTLTTMATRSGAIAASGIYPAIPALPASDINFHELRVIIIPGSGLITAAPGITIEVYLDSVLVMSFAESTTTAAITNGPSYFNFGGNVGGVAPFTSGTCGPGSNGYALVYLDPKDLTVSGSLGARRYDQQVKASHMSQAAVAVSGNADASPLASTQISARHFSGGNAADSAPMVDSSSKLLYARHAPVVTSNFNATGDSYVGVEFEGTRRLSPGDANAPGALYLPNAVGMWSTNASAVACPFSMDAAFTPQGGTGFLEFYFFSATRPTNSDPAACYLVQAINTGVIYVYKQTSGTFVSLGGAAAPSGWSTTGTHRLRVSVATVASATVINVWLDENFFTCSDSSSPYTSGYYGFRSTASAGTGAYVHYVSVRGGRETLDMGAPHTGQLAFPQHAPAVQSALTATAGSDGSYVASQSLYDRHVVASIPRKNLIVNGNNCNGTGAVLPSSFGWTGTFGSGAASPISGGAYGSFTSIEYLKSSTASQQGFTQDVPVTPGQTYTLQFLLYVGPTGTMNPVVWIGKADYSAQYNNIFTAPVNAATIPAFYSGAANHTNSWAFSSVSGSPTSEWCHLYQTFTVPSGISTMRVLVYDQGTSANAVFYVAGVMLTEGSRLQDYIDHEGNAGSISNRHFSGSATQDGLNDGTTYQRVCATELASGKVTRLNDGTNVRTAAQLAAILLASAGSDGSYLASQIVYDRHVASEIPRKNIVLNGNNCAGTGATAPSAFGWTGAFNTTAVPFSGGNYGSFTSIGFTKTATAAAQGYYQDVPVNPGQTYTFSVLFYGAAAGMTPSIFIGNAALNVQYNNAPGAPVNAGSFPAFYTSASAHVNSWTTTLVSEWVHLYGTFTVPSGVTSARVLLYDSSTTASQSFFVQGAMLTEGSRLQDYIDHEGNAGSISNHQFSSGATQDGLGDGTSFRRPYNYNHQANNYLENPYFSIAPVSPTTEVAANWAVLPTANLAYNGGSGWTDSQEYSTNGTALIGNYDVLAVYQTIGAGLANGGTSSNRVTSERFIPARYGDTFVLNVYYETTQSGSNLPSGVVMNFNFGFYRYYSDGTNDTGAGAVGVEHIGGVSTTSGGYVLAQSIYTVGQPTGKTIVGFVVTLEMEIANSSGSTYSSGANTYSVRLGYVQLYRCTNLGSEVVGAFAAGAALATRGGGSQATSLPPVLTAAGAAVATTMHVVKDTVTATSTSTTVTFSGDAAFADANYYLMINNVTGLTGNTNPTAKTATSFTFSSVSSDVYSFVAIGA